MVKTNDNCYMKRHVVVMVYTISQKNQELTCESPSHSPAERAPPTPPSEVTVLRPEEKEREEEEAAAESRSSHHHVIITGRDSTVRKCQSRPGPARTVWIRDYTRTLHPNPARTVWIRADTRALHPNPATEPCTRTLHPNPAPEPCTRTLHPNPARTWDLDTVRSLCTG
ncbi:unnamed protein product [Pleuronectes platessa]|uniref:Uncharacterized protein n=1 Tax=Pleuronectes platessa TaxID=8262 RepID=A0A9N7V738_PLEPL|nr:unnamed protein product [Pleuronectes platessa]